MSPDDSIKIEYRIVSIVNAGYVVEKKKWGGLIITDPSVKYAWETADMMVDIKRILT